MPKKTPTIADHINSARDREVFRRLDNIETAMKLSAQRFNTLVQMVDAAEKRLASVNNLLTNPTGNMQGWIIELERQVNTLKSRFGGFQLWLFDERLNKLEKHRWHRRAWATVREWWAARNREWDGVAPMPCPPKAKAAPASRVPASWTWQGLKGSEWVTLDRVCASFRCACPRCVATREVDRLAREIADLALVDAEIPAGMWHVYKAAKAREAEAAK